MRSRVGPGQPGDSCRCAPGAPAERRAGNQRAAEASRPSRMPPGGAGDGSLADARGRLAEALRAVSAAQSSLPALEAALAAGRTPGKGHLAGLDGVRSALENAARALGVDPERATLAELEARLAAREEDVALRGALRRLAQATGPAIAATELVRLAADAARLAAAPAWSPDEEARAGAPVRLVDLADATTRDGAEELILSLDAELRRSLGASGPPVVLAAARGRLVPPPPPAPGPDDSPDGQMPPGPGRPLRSSVPVPSARPTPEGGPPGPRWGSPDGQRPIGNGRARETAPLSGRGQRAVAASAVAAAPAVVRPARPPERAGAGSVQHPDHAEGY